MKIFSDQQLSHIAAVGAYPWLVMEDPAHVLPAVQGKVFSMQLENGAATGHFVAEPYDLLFSRNHRHQNIWTLRQKSNGGFLSIFASAPTMDGWLVDGGMRARSDVRFYNPQNAPVHVRFVGHSRGAARAAEVIDVDATQPQVLQQIFSALQTQSQSQKIALDESKAIFQQIQNTVRDKLGAVEEKVASLETNKAETVTALLEQKDSMLWGS